MISTSLRFQSPYAMNTTVCIVKAAGLEDGGDIPQIPESKCYEHECVVETAGLQDDCDTLQIPESKYNECCMTVW